MRILGIDLGRARTGLALSDPLGLTCRPLAVVHEKDEARLIRRIAVVAEENGVTTLVLGLPRPLSGGTNAQIESVVAFAAHLAQEVPVPVVTWDERFTTKLAERTKGRSAARDAVAASYMLQNYLDSRTNATGDDNEYEQKTQAV